MRIRTSEQLLLHAVPTFVGCEFYCTSLGRAQLAEAIANQFPRAKVCCHFLDVYQAEQAQRAWPKLADRLEIHCASDAPPREFDVAAIPCTAQGDAELTRDLLQTAFESLRIGGRLFAATDNRRDSWLGEQMAELFRKRITRTSAKHGMVYSGVKHEPLRRRRDFMCEFAFRDGERLIRAFSRPGVFSHRHLDLGSRALLESMTVHDGERVLDLGCGAGVVSIAAALRAAKVHVTSIDANPRAIDCTRRGAELNGLANIRPLLNADADSGAPGTFDLVVANPPYFSHYRIGEIFVRGAERALKPDGRFQLVTKQPVAYAELLNSLAFRELTTVEVRKYAIVSALRR